MSIAAMGEAYHPPIATGAMDGCVLDAQEKKQIPFGNDNKKRQRQKQIR
jgi:hypothetical protein